MNTGTNTSDCPEGLIACPSCDALADLSTLQNGENAKCVYCGHFLTQVKDDLLPRVIAYSLASLIFLALALSYPLLAFKVAGMESVTTLPQACWSLYLNGMPELAFLVAAFIIVLPAVSLLLALYVSILLLTRSTSPTVVICARVQFMLQFWCMVDVFLIGVIVSLVKLAGMADLVLGLSFWAYAAFAISFTLALSNFDRVQIWQRIQKQVGLLYEA